MRSLKQHMLLYSKVISLIVFIAFIFTFISVNIWAHNVKKNVFEYNEGWNVKTDENDIYNIKLPLNTDLTGNNENIIIKNVIPSDITESTYLLMRSELQRIKIFINNDIIFNLQEDNEQLFGKEPESRWIFVNLSNLKGNEEIRIEYNSKYKWINSHINGLLLGNKTDLTYYIISEYGAGVITSILFLGIGIILAAMYLGLLKSEGKFIRVFYLAIINLIVSLWIGSDSKAIELFIPNWFPIAEFKILSMYITAIIIFIFFIEILECKKNIIIKALLTSYLIFTITSTILHILNVVHLVQTMFIFHIITIISILFVIYYSIIQIKRKNLFSRFVLISIVLLTFSVISDIVLYYLTHGQQTSDFFRISLLLISIIFSVVLGRQVLSLYNEEIKNKVYKELAYTDSLTGLGNRGAFNDKMLSMTENFSKYNFSKFFLFDLNNLKSVNDNLGHEMGDTYIKEVSNIIKSTFGEYGNLYRIGGDEFVFISEKSFDEDKVIETMVEKSNNLKREFKGIDIGIAYGKSNVFSNESKNPFDSYSIADKKMYETKRKMKKR